MEAEWQRFGGGGGGGANRSQLFKAAWRKQLTRSDNPEGRSETHAGKHNTHSAHAYTLFTTCRALFFSSFFWILDSPLLRVKLKLIEILFWSFWQGQSINPIWGEDRPLFNQKIKAIIVRGLLLYINSAVLINCSRFKKTKQKKRAHQGEEPLEREVNKPVSITGERLIRIDEKSFNFQEKTWLTVERRGWHPLGIWAMTIEVWFFC